MSILHLTKQFTNLESLFVKNIEHLSTKNTLKYI